MLPHFASRPRAPWRQISRHMPLVLLRFLLRLALHLLLLVLLALGVVLRMTDGDMRRQGLTGARTAALDGGGHAAYPGAVTQPTAAGPGGPERQMPKR